MGDATATNTQNEGGGPSRQKATARKTTAPKMYDMLVEAITNLNDRKGASVPGIKNYILETYTSVDPNMLKYRLRRALEKAIESGVVVRPKGSENSGASLSGRFRLDKAKLVALNKPKEKKTKTAAKSETKPKKKATVEKKSPGKSSKSAKKAKTSTKSAKSPTKKAKKTGEKTKKATDKTKKKPKAKTLTKDKPAKKTTKPKAK